MADARQKNTEEKDVDDCELSASREESGHDRELLFGEDYEQFDPSEYLKRYFLIGGQTEKIKEKIEDSMLWFHEIFASGKFGGRRLLDVCSGPSIHTVISASKFYTDIYLLEYARVNRDYQRKWIEREKDAADWSEMFHWAAKNEGGGIKAENVEERVRRAIRGVFPCDLTKEEPFEADGIPQEPVDAIVSHWTLETAATDRKSYESMLRKMCGHLAPGGFLFLAGLLHQTFYVASESKKFQSLGLDLDFVRNTMKKVGLKEIDFKVIDFDTNLANSDTQKRLYLAAQKM